MMFGTQHINCYSTGNCILDFRIPPGTTRYWFDATRNYPDPTTNYGFEPLGWESTYSLNNPSNCDGWSTNAGGGLTGTQLPEMGLMVQSFVLVD